jgi:hypothetical protein
VDSLAKPARALLGPNWPQSGRCLPNRLRHGCQPKRYTSTLSNYRPKSRHRQQELLAVVPCQDAWIQDHRYGSNDDRRFKRPDRTPSRRRDLSRRARFRSGLAGWHGLLTKARRPEEQVRVYERLAQAIPLLARSRILPISYAAMMRYEALKRMTPNVRKMDLRIASIVIDHGAKLATRNVRDSSGSLGSSSKLGVLTPTRLFGASVLSPLRRSASRCRQTIRLGVSPT